MSVYMHVYVDVYTYVYIDICIHMCVCMCMYAPQSNFLKFFEDPTTESMKVKHSVSFCFIFANQNIKAQS